MPRVLGALLLLAFGLPAAELSIGQATVSRGKTVSLPVTLRTGGAALAILQFDLFYDGSVMAVSGTIGPAAAGAGKNLAVSDLTKDRKRILLFGVNREKLSDGVVLRLQFDVKGNAPVRDYPIQIKELVATDPDAGSISVTGVDGKLTVRGGQ